MLDNDRATPSSGLTTPKVYAPRVHAWQFAVQPYETSPVEVHSLDVQPVEAQPLEVVVKAVDPHAADAPGADPASAKPLVLAHNRLSLLWRTHPRLTPMRVAALGAGVAIVAVALVFGVGAWAFHRGPSWAPVASATMDSPGSTVMVKAAGGSITAVTFTLPVEATARPLGGAGAPTLSSFPLLGRLELGESTLRYGLVRPGALPFSATVAGVFLDEPMFVQNRMPLVPGLLDDAPAVTLSCQETGADGMSDRVVAISTGHGVVWISWRGPTAESARFDTVLRSVRVPKAGPVTGWVNVAPHAGPSAGAPTCTSRLP